MVGDVVSWEAVVSALTDADEPASSIQVLNTAYDRNRRYLSTGLGPQNILARDCGSTGSQVQALCGAHGWRLQHHCTDISLAGEARSSAGRLSKARQWVFGVGDVPCKFISVSFRAEFGDSHEKTLLVQTVASQQSEGQRQSSEYLISFDELQELIRRISWPSCTVAEAEPETSTTVIGGAGQAGHSRPQHSWASLDLGLLVSQMPWDAYLVAFCPVQEYRLQPNTRDLPRTATRAMQDVEEWLTAVRLCVDAASGARTDWIRVALFWNDDQDGHSAVSWQGHYMV
ncbi:hypothetical protein CALCODRAFT_144167 [Calocera cornea HHB12733]|uniref:Uncharacterized protein n=1 Tax=Calocera cornea HHB12733 TaxID=1353952 RepID=A0A165CSL5_9BASI|nr:hypothetical protein CALCODRAFT_144167 [Calocera cornea HHB12733]